jgi:YebC/PmpR family DNA-binding regulatory protein
MGKGWKAPAKMEQAQKKGQLFTKVAREVAVAAKLGGPDPEANSRLKMAIAAAKEVSCPKDTIERAIKKGSGQLNDGSNDIEEITYEGLGPGGVGFLIECQTDNRNRTVSDLRTIFKKHDGSLGESGSVAWNFDRLAMVVATKQNVTDPEEAAIEVGANEVLPIEDNHYIFYGSLTDLEQMRSGLLNMGWEIKAAEPSYKAKNQIRVDDPETKNVLLKLQQALEDCDDSSRVHSNLE